MNSILWALLLIGFPLGDVELLLCEMGGAHELAPDIVEALDGAHGGGAYGGAAAAMGEESLDGVARYVDELGVHLVVANLLALDGTEGAGADMEGDLIALYTSLIDGTQHAVGEMQSRGGGCHGAVNLRIHSLVGVEVALLCGAVEVGGDGQLAHGLEQGGEGVGVVPLKADDIAVAVLTDEGGGQ